MRWRAHAFNAVIQRLTGFVTRASTTDCRPKGAAISGTAKPMNSKRLTDVQPLLERRAAKVTNKSLRGLYLRQHQILRKGV